MAGTTGAVTDATTIVTPATRFARALDGPHDDVVASPKSGWGDARVRFLDGSAVAARHLEHHCRTAAGVGRARRWVVVLRLGGWGIVPPRRRPRLSQPSARIDHCVGSWSVLMIDSTQLTVTSCPPHRLVLRARGWPFGEAATIDIVVITTARGDRITLAQNASRGPARLVPQTARGALIVPRTRESVHRLALLAEGCTA